MVKIINTIFCFLKVILLLVSFVFSFFIIFNMYKRLDKNYIETLSVFFPYLLLFILFSVNLVLRQKQVNHNIFYNITCCVVFCALIFAGYRALFDENMVVTIRLGYKINFNYYADMIAPMRAMLYILIVSNILLMFDVKGKTGKEKIIRDFPSTSEPIPISKEA